MTTKLNTVTLKRQLNAFEKADTSSPLIGTIPEGEYELLEFKENYPSQETDYALVFDPKRNKGVWICSRYKETTYIANHQNIVSYDFENDDHAIDEQELIKLLPEFNGFSYDLHKPTYPFSLKGCNVPQAPPVQNNCCTFVEALFVKAWENVFSDFSWNNKNHGQMMITSADDYYSPITCLIEQKMAVAITDNNQAPQPWTVVQGWRDQWKGGHTFIILDHHKETDRVLTLESNAAYQLNGVGYRMIGNIADHPHPTSTWWKNESLWTWKKIKSAYAYRKSGKLKVKHIKWV